MTTLADMDQRRTRDAPRGPVDSHGCVCRARGFSEELKEHGSCMQ